MTARRICSCGQLTQRGQSRCAPCCAAVRRRRNGDRKGNAAVVAAATVCAICGRPPTGRDPLTADHIVAVARGGSSAPNNLRPVHRSCNSRKGAR